MKKRKQRKMPEIELPDMRNVIVPAGSYSVVTTTTAGGSTISDKYKERLDAMEKRIKLLEEKLMAIHIDKMSGC